MQLLLASRCREEGVSASPGLAVRIPFHIHLYEYGLVVLTTRNAQMSLFHHPFNGPPDGYQTPRFPSLNVQTVYDTTPRRVYTLYYIKDVWRFTVIWTVIIYALFHLAAVIIALFTHGRRMSTWKYLWAIPIIYIVIAGLQAVVTGSIVGAV